MRFGLMLLLLTASAGTLAAQSDPQLVAAVRLAQEGQGDSARALAGRILAATAPTDPKYPEVVYTVALVAATTGERRLQLERLAVEFASSDWADDALLQLAQLDFAARNQTGTMQQVQRLLADYPLSPLRAVAALWGARAAFDTRNRALGCQWVDLGLEAAGSDVETRNQLDFQRERCRVLTTMESTAAAQPPPPPPAPPPAPLEKSWQVQVAAFKSRPEADAMQQRLQVLEIAARVIREGTWFKVRAGPFADRARAQQALTRIRREFGEGPFLVPPR